MTRRQTLTLFAIMLMVVIIDQIIKYEVKTTMTLSQHIIVTDWFHIAFVENKGMAFGWSFGSKIFLTLFRLLTVGIIIYYTLRLLHRQQHMGFVVCLALIIGGAIGNIVDSIFYGMMFTESTHTDVAVMTRWGEGYASLLEGKVVDMFYFPLIEWNMPMSWTWLNSISFLPNAGEHCVFFSPVFNFADSCISVGVVILVLFFRQSFSRCLTSNSQSNETADSNVSVETATADTLTETAEMTEATTAETTEATTAETTEATTNTPTTDTTL